MKRYIKTIALALAVAASGTFTSCSEDDIYKVDINNVPMASEYADCVDITVDQNTNYATFTFTGKGVYPVWIIDGKSYSTNHSFSRYYRKAGDYSVELKVGNGNGISNGTITKSFTIDKTMMSGFGGFVYDSPFNLWTAATKQINSFFYAPGWTQLPGPEHSFDGETFSVVFPEATTEQWQNQIHIGTDICLNEGESFDGSFIFTSTMDMKNVTLEIHPDGDDDDSHSFFCNQKINLSAGEPVTYWFSNLPAVVPMNNLVFTLDFGGNPAGMEVTIENFVLKNHTNDDGTELPDLPTTPEPDWVDVNSPENLFAGMSYTPSFYYAPGWSQLPDPDFSDNGNGSYTFGLPSATFERWQAQCLLNTDVVIPDASVAYDFTCTIESNADLVAMVKVVETDEGETKHDNNFFCAEEVSIKSGVNKVWFASLLPNEGTPMHAVSLVFDFGGNPDGTELTVSNIILQVHHD